MRLVAVGALLVLYAGLAPCGRRFRARTEPAPALRSSIWSLAHGLGLSAQIASMPDWLA